MKNSAVILVDSFSLLNVRMVFLLIALVHLSITAFVALRIDTTVDKDPKIRAYNTMKWKLLTCWLNLIMWAYLPMRLWADWRTKKGEGESFSVKFLYQFSDVIMTAVLFPVTMFSNITFLYLYIYNPNLMAPPELFQYLPNWVQHSLHTVTIFVVLLDLMLTPRKHPKTLKPRICMLIAFSFTYIMVVYMSLLNGEVLYAIFEKMDKRQFILLAVFSFISVMIIFTIQWMIIDLLHGTKHNTKKII